MSLTEARPAQSERDLEQARLAVIQEWTRQSPTTPEEIASFYRSSERLGDELDAWHATPARQKWTEIVVHVAGHIGAKLAIDIGCGGGHELRALRAAHPDLDLIGVEPNVRMSSRLQLDGLLTVPDVADAPIERADLLLCLDVLEHLPDPQAFLADLAGRARLGAVLVETTATHDTFSPLHLASNRAWHPGYCLESLGWEILDERGRVRVWQRARLKAEPHASALLCAYRTCSIPTMISLLKLQDAGWHVRAKYGDGLISRARSIIASKWYRETADDVFLMIDDDIRFEPQDAIRLVEQCRNGHDIICAAYPIRDGANLAIATFTADPIRFHEDEPLMEIRYASTGFLAVHRRVLDALIPTMPLCHANQPWAFWPLFGPFAMPEADPIEHIYLSEDWAFVQRARDLGFKVWLDPTIKLGHLAQVEVDVMNMGHVHAAHKARLGESEQDDG